MKIYRKKKSVIGVEEEYFKEDLYEEVEGTKDQWEKLLKHGDSITEDGES